MTEEPQEEPHGIYWRLTKAHVFECAPMVAAIQRSHQQKDYNSNHHHHNNNNYTTPLSINQINTLYAACVASVVHQDIHNSQYYTDNTSHDSNNNNHNDNNQGNISCLPSVEDMQQAAKGFYSQADTAQLERRIVACFHHDTATQNAADRISRYELTKSRSLSKYADLVHHYTDNLDGTGHSDHINNNNNNINDNDNDNNNNTHHIQPDTTISSSSSSSLTNAALTECRNERQRYRRCIQSAVGDRLSTEATRNRCFAERLKYDTCQLSVLCAPSLSACMSRSGSSAATALEQCLKTDGAVARCIGAVKGDDTADDISGTRSGAEE